ncbi:MAG: tetratricopeptide repeat protein [Ardenticatenia bacterium]|nr:tetratricopeptide repeat protein [Ardenticatenia bacterium]
MIRLAASAAHGAKLKRYYSLPMKVVAQTTLQSRPDSSLNWYETDIGWTEKLHSIHASIRAKQDQPLLVTEILDFDDSSLLVAENLELRLSRLVKDTEKEPFFEALRELREAQLGGAGVDSLTSRRRSVTEALAKGLNASHPGQRLLIFFDTFEKIDLDVCNRLLTLTSSLKDAISFLAGRPDPRKEVNDLVERTVGKQITPLRIQAFRPDESIAYFEQKQLSMHTELSKRLVQRLLVLTNGRPILIDLAVEYISRSISIESLMKISPRAFKNLSLDAQIELRITFEAELVRHLLYLQNSMDLLVLVVSRVFPLSSEMIAQLLNLSPSEAEDLFNEACTLVFMRVLPNQQGITLHDEMRRMIITHVWPEIDPDEARQRRDSLLAAKLYRRLDAGLYSQKKLREAESVSDRLSELVRAADIQSIELDPALATERWLEHYLYAYPLTQFDEWIDVVDKLRSGGRGKAELIARLVKVAIPYRKQATEVQRFHVDLHSARSLIDGTQQSNSGRSVLVEANNRLGQLLRAADDNESHKSSVFNVLGVVATRQGFYEKALHYQLECRQMMDTVDKHAYAKVTNQLGYISRLQGDYDKAISYYEEAQRVIGEDVQSGSSKASRETNLSLLASVLTNSAYVYGLKKDYSMADILCRDAISIWSDINRRPDIARAETTLAILARDRGYNARALDLLESAIGRLKESEHNQELCRAYYHLGWTQWHLAEIHNDREQDIADVSWDTLGLERSLESFRISDYFAEKYSFDAERPGILHQMASVYWHLGRTCNNSQYLKEARRLNKLAHSLSLSIGDSRYAIDSLLGFAEWDYEAGQYRRIEEYANQLGKSSVIYKSSSSCTLVGCDGFKPT